MSAHCNGPWPPTPPPKTTTSTTTMGSCEWWRLWRVLIPTSKKTLSARRMENLEKSLRVYVYSGQWKRIRFSITEMTVCSVRWYQAMVINIYSPGKAKASCATSAVLFVLLLAAWMFHDNWRVETLWTIKSVSGWCTIENCQHWFCVVHQ